MNEHNYYGAGNLNSRSWQEVYREQMQGFREYLRLRQELFDQGVLSPPAQSRLEGLIDEMRNCFFLPEKYSFYVSLCGRDQVIYRRMFLSI